MTTQKTSRGRPTTIKQRPKSRLLRTTIRRRWGLGNCTFQILSLIGEESVKRENQRTGDLSSIGNLLELIREITKAKLKELILISLKIAGGRPLEEEFS
jgi:hypothetical protein